MGMALTKTNLIGSVLVKLVLYGFQSYLVPFTYRDFKSDVGKKEIEIEYTQYKNYLENGDIAKGVIMGDVFHGEFKIPQTLNTPYGNALNNISHFKLNLPFIDREITKEWDEAGIEYTFKEKTIDWTGYLLNMLPWVLLIGFWFMIRRMQGGSGGVGVYLNLKKVVQLYGHLTSLVSLFEMLLDARRLKKN